MNDQKKPSSALNIKNIHAQMSGKVETSIEKSIDGKTIKTVSIDLISPDKEQPRKFIDFDSDEMKELAQSIKENGFIHFPLVRKVEDGYIIISGERRYHAAKLAGLKEIPVAVVEHVQQEKIAILQIEENLHRKNISPIEEARAYKKLSEYHKMSQRNICDLVNKDKYYISRMMSINDIDCEILEAIEKKNIDISRRVLTKLSKLEKENQKQVWVQIETNPIESSIVNAIEKVEQKKVAHNPQEQKQNIEPKEVKQKQGKKEITEDSENYRKYLETELDKKNTEIERIKKKNQELQETFDAMVNNRDEQVKKLKAELEEARLEIQDLKKQNLRNNVKDVTK